MSSVAVDDGHPGDGADVQRSRYSYEGAVYDPLLRDALGFSSVREDQVDQAGTLLRRYEREYLNSTPYDAGLLTSSGCSTPAGEARCSRRVDVGVGSWPTATRSPTRTARPSTVCRRSAPRRARRCSTARCGRG